MSSTINEHWRQTQKAYKMKKLRLSRNRKLFGVCGGFAEYFDVDPAIVRILMIVGILCSCGYGMAFYFLCAIFIDKADISYIQSREEPPEIPNKIPNKVQWERFGSNDTDTGYFNPNDTYTR